MIGSENVMSLKGQSPDVLVSFLMRFLEEFDRDIKDMKLNLASRLRGAATAYANWL